MPSKKTYNPGLATSKVKSMWWRVPSTVAEFFDMKGFMPVKFILYPSNEVFDPEGSTFDTQRIASEHKAIQVWLKKMRSWMRKNLTQTHELVEIIEDGIIFFQKGRRPSDNDYRNCIEEMDSERLCNSLYSRRASHNGYLLFVQKQDLTTLLMMMNDK